MWYLDSKSPTLTTEASKFDDDKFEIILKNNGKLIVSKRKLKKLKDEYLEFIMNDTV